MRASSHVLAARRENFVNSRRAFNRTSDLALVSLLRSCSTAMAEAREAILVLNAGSSSLKFAVFAKRAGELARELHGEVEGLYTAPRFRAYDPAGRVVG